MQRVPAHCGLYTVQHRASGRPRAGGGGAAPSLNAKFRSTSRPSSRPSCSPSAPPGNSWPHGWFRPMWRDRRPVPVEEANRSIVNSCQLRADHHWSESEECLRIGRLSSPDCTQCSSDEYPTALRQHYRGKAGIPKCAYSYMCCSGAPGAGGTPPPTPVQHHSLRFITVLISCNGL